MIPFRPTAVVAKWPKLTAPPDIKPSQAEGARAHEFEDFRFKLDKVKLKIMHPKTNKTREIRLQKYQEVNKAAWGLLSIGLKQHV